MEPMTDSGKVRRCFVSETAWDARMELQWELEMECTTEREKADEMEPMDALMEPSKERQSDSTCKVQ